MPSRPGKTPRASHRSGLDTLASSGSCPRAKATAFRYLFGSSRCRLTQPNAGDPPWVRGGKVSGEPASPRAFAISGVIHFRTTSWVIGASAASSIGRILPRRAQKTAGFSLATRTSQEDPPSSTKADHEVEAMEAVLLNPAQHGGAGCQPLAANLAGPAARPWRTGLSWLRREAPLVVRRRQLRADAAGALRFDAVKSLQVGTQFGADQADRLF
jgi:hypothetical protein